MLMNRVTRYSVWRTKLLTRRKKLNACTELSLENFLKAVCFITIMEDCSGARMNLPVQSNCGFAALRRIRTTRATTTMARGINTCLKIKFGDCYMEKFS